MITGGRTFRRAVELSDSVTEKIIILVYVLLRKYPSGKEFNLLDEFCVK